MLAQSFGLAAILGVQRTDSDPGLNHQHVVWSCSICLCLFPSMIDLRYGVGSWSSSFVSFLSSVSARVATRRLSLWLR